MGRLVGIVVVAALALAACGSSTTTVVNNTTTVTAEATDSTAGEAGSTTAETSTAKEADFVYCGPDSPDGAGVYEVQAANVDCDLGSMVADGWLTAGCNTQKKPCDVNRWICVKRERSYLKAFVYCGPGPTLGPINGRAVIFRFANDV